MRATEPALPSSVDKSHQAVAEKHAVPLPDERQKTGESLPGTERAWQWGHARVEASSMRGDVAARIISRLEQDFGGKQNPTNRWWQYGRCPSCGKKELYTHLDTPWVVRCGRIEKCGYEFSTKDRYPELFASFNQRFKPSREDPNATAKAYLRYARGIDPARIGGWFEQGKYWHPDADRGTATVRFYIDRARTAYMERFVETVTLTDPETGERESRKQNFKNSHRGLWWTPPGQVIEAGDEVWITEAVLDAIPLALAGKKVAAILSCVNYPDKALEAYKSRHITWVWALDNDKAGRRHTLKHVARMRNERLIAAAAQPAEEHGEKVDWNDLHQRDRLRTKDFTHYRYLGELLIAESATEKALLIHQHEQRYEFHFEFQQRIYWCKINPDQVEKYVQQYMEGGLNGSPMDSDEARKAALRNSNSVYQIANCTFRFLYYQFNAITDESWYYCRVDFPHGGKTVKNTFTGGQVSSASEFKKRLLGIAAGAIFTGKSDQLDRILERQLFGLKTVETIDYVGYSKEHHAYIYNNLAVKEGRVFSLNDEDFFDIGKLSVKTLSQSVPLNLSQHRDKYTTEWVDLLYQCYGEQGIIALAYWLGSLFAEQLRERQKSYPFIEIVGDAGAGKSTLIEFLWKLVGREGYEGFDPNKSTRAARARNFSQVSNLPVVLIESDRESEDNAKVKQFDWDELKPLYNGRGIFSRGVKNSGNETYEPPFRAAVVISQNNAVLASDATMQRIIHLHFTTATHTSETRALAERLERLPIDRVNHFLIEAVMREKELLALADRLTPTYEKKLMALPELKSVRIAKNHAQILSLIDALGPLLNLSEERIRRTTAAVSQLAVQRQQAINADHRIVMEFWEAFEHLDQLGSDGQPLLNHSNNDREIAVNLKHVEQMANQWRIGIPPLSELRRHLKTSKSRKYITQKAVASAIHRNGSTPKTYKCWVFEQGN